MPAIAGPSAAPVTAVAICDAATIQKPCANQSSKDASTVITPATMITARLYRVASTRAPAGDVASIPAMPPNGHHGADQISSPTPRLQEYAEKWANPCLHVGHEEIQSLKRACCLAGGQDGHLSRRRHQARPFLLGPSCEPSKPWSAHSPTACASVPGGAAANARLPAPCRESTSIVSNALLPFASDATTVT